MVYDKSNGVMSLASGRETETMVAFGSSSKILPSSLAYRIEWDDESADEGNWSPAISLSVDITLYKQN